MITTNTKKQQIGVMKKMNDHVNLSLEGWYAESLSRNNEDEEDIKCTHCGHHFTNAYNYWLNVPDNICPICLIFNEREEK